MIFLKVLLIISLVVIAVILGLIMVSIVMISFSQDVDLDADDPDILYQNKLDVYE